MELQVPVTGPRERADKLVSALLALSGRRVPRAEIQRWMKHGRVLAGGRPVDRADHLPAGTMLLLRPAPGPETAVRPDPSVVFAVVFEDEHLVVLDKPPGLVVHPARGHRGGTLVGGLLARGGFERAGEDERDPQAHLRPGIVHRLDKDTSGLLVVAKTPAAREGLRALFARHDVERFYLAIAVGHARRASYDTPYGRHPRSRVRFTSKLPAGRPGERRAVTDVEPVESLAGATLVRCRLGTGRTHQIRVHLAEQSGTPVLGDAQYGRRPADPALREIAAALGRQALHAALLGFVHPVTAERVRWHSPLPADMQRALDRLRALAPAPTRPSPSRARQT
ncbi:MAG: RluA family pseudouridine synthase [Deltaproteobacteria bacterium]|nr:RluA family pseudouridine synthase [Deltaproteobacteria bacterium]